MRIVYIQNARIPTEKAHGYQIAKMCEAWGRAGHKVSLWLPRRQPTSAMALTSVYDAYGVERSFDVRILANVDVGPLSSARFASLGTLLFGLQSRLWARAAARHVIASDVDLCFTRDPWIAAELATRRLPVVLELHSVPARLGRDALLRLVSTPSLHRVVAVTAGIAQDVEALGFNRASIRVLHDAVDLRMFVDLMPRSESRALLGLPIDKKIVGYVGRFQTMGREKGLPELVRAMAWVEGSALLIAVGGPLDDVPSYLAQASLAGVEPGRISFYDRVDPIAVPNWISAFDVATIPWPDEPHLARYASPMKLFEYMAAGAAIVASDLPSIREVLTDDHDARLVKAGDPQALAGGIQELLDDEALRRRFGVAARQKAEAFTWDGRAAAAIEGLEG